MSGIQQLLLGSGQGAAVPVDPYFYSVTSLLHGDGTNGGQNNTFLDSSTNNFTITRNGNTTQGSFSPFSQTGWSGYFNGSSDYISVADSADFTMGSGDFTIQCWVYSTANSGSDQYILGQVNSGGTAAATSFQLYKKATSNVAEAFVYAGATKVATGTAQIPVGQWTHLAMVRDGGTLRLYVNGSQDGTNATLSTTAITDSAGSFSVGRTGDYNGLYFAGYVSNVSVVKGTCLFPSGTTFTPSTTPLSTSTSGQSVLLCQANRFIDTNTATTAKTVTVGSTSSIQPFSPFNPITAYSTSTVGGSGYFDGSGDNISIADNANLRFGTSDYTIEGWIYPITLPAGDAVVVSKDASGQRSWIVALRSAYGLAFFIGGTNQTGTNQIPTNAWTHFAVVRSGTSAAFFINGTRVATFTDSSNYTQTAPVEIGASVPVWNDPNNAYITNVRLVKGTAVYSPSSTTLTVPTAPLTAVSNTQLLCNFTNGAIFDNAAVADYETVGNAQISTSVKKYGTGSLAFDGTGDWLVSPASPNWDFGSGDFTVELWINPSATTAGEALVSKGNASSTGNEVWTLQWYGTNQLAFFSGGGLGTPVVNTGSVFATGNWYHVAVCRAAGVTKIFVNGTVQGTSTTSYTITAGGALYVGAGWFNPADRDISGYIDDLRISKGVARYLYNFTPPTAAFPDIGGPFPTLTADPYYEYTTLLLPGNGTNGAQNNTFLDSSANAFSITRNGNTTQGTFSPFSQTGWGNYFDGTGDWLNAGAQTAYNFGTGDFTVETWVYCTASTWTGGDASGATVLFDTRNQSNSTEANRFTLGVLSSGSVPWFYNADANVRTDSGVPALVGTWNHIAWTRASGTVRIFVNGVQGVSFTDATSFSVARLGIAAGAAVGGGTNDRSGLIGYLSNARWVKGTAVYTSNFTPPTAPLTAITNTSLLTCQSNRFIDNSTNNFAITANGDVSVQAFSPFNPTASWSAATNGGSGYFDGSGDYLTTASSTSLALGSGDFTVDVWFYPTTTNTYFPIDFRTGCTLYFYVTSGTTVNVAIGGNAETTFTGVVTNAWNHFACVRSGSGSNNVSYYLNGVRGAQQTDTTNFSSATTITLGKRYTAFSGNEFYLAGYLGSTRLVVGTAVYSGATYTVPTAPLTAITNTQLLTNFTNAGITDATSKNDLETVGNAQISTTQSKFGGSSMYFDGTGDWLRAPASPNLDMGTGDLTIEGWFYLTATVAVDYRMIVSDATNGNNYVSIRGGGTGGQLEVNVNGTSFRLNLNNTVTINTWFHLAVVRYNGTWNGFVNGASLGTSAAAAAFNLGNGGMFVGRFGGATAYEWPGYIDDLRITKGIARYTSNFTPPTTAFLTL